MRHAAPLLLGFLLAGTLHAAEPTAFDLIKEGNRHVGDEVKDQVVQIRSEKSVGSTTPTEWAIVYYDRDASFKATEVRFVGGRKTEVRRPGRLLERLGSHSPLEKDRLKTDSNKAIEIALAEPALANLKITNTRLVLERWENLVVWKVRLWVSKIRKPQDTADVGEVFINAEDSRVVRSDLKPRRAD